MKKNIITLSILLVIALTGCIQEETYEKGVPTYFLEPEGYIIATVDLNDGNVFGSFLYGYIAEEDYQSYLEGTLSNSLIVKNPYVEGKETSTSIENINYIEIGVYKDYRQYID
ncbi:MAG: hypothetical protein K2L07_04855 [Lachnospiraceae bacterium]|nr:hypothetical protein [Lachnospiraceae bacterium]